MIQTRKDNQKNKTISLAHSVPIKTPQIMPVPNRQKRVQATSKIISGYFVNEQSYKQMVIERINKVLCCVLGVLVSICLISYYFVTTSEIKLNQIQKDTLALAYENEDMQNKLDSLQSYYNVDKTITQNNILKKATQIMELPAQTPPGINFKKSNKTKQVNTWSLGY